MGSLVAEILSSARKLEKDDINKKVAKLSQHVDDLKMKICEFISSQHEDFTLSVSKTEDLFNQVTNTTNEIQTLSNKIDVKIRGKLNTTADEFQDLKKRLENSSLITTILSQLLGIETNLDSIENCFGKLDYLGAAEAVGNVKVILGNVTLDCDDRLSMLPSLHTEYLVRREKLVYDLGEIWMNHVTWNVPREKTNSVGGVLVEFKLVFVGCKTMAQITNLISAMHSLGQLKLKLKAFGDKLTKTFVEFIVSSCVQVKQVSEADYVSIMLILEESVEIKPKPYEVLQNLTVLFELLYNSFLTVKVKTCDESQDEYVTLMSILGGLISESFCEYVIENCLSIAIPKSSKTLETYTPIIEATSDFQISLIKQGFLRSENEAMTKFSQNVKVLFINKMCQDILSKARDLTKKELFSTVDVTDSDEDETLNSDGCSNEKIKSKPLAPENKLKNVFAFPTCKISVSVKELLSLVDDVLKEASESNAVCAARLFYTARNIFELYCDVVPVYHKDNLETLPQLSAIHHNNCMYISHRLQTLGHRCKPSLPEPVASANVTFIDIVPRIRRLGTDVFLAQMLRQKLQLFESLKGASGFQNVAMDENFQPAAEKSIKQCLHRLNSLQRVWHDVLPINVYCKAMGTLINSLIDNIVMSVISQEDISADNAIQLISMFGIISERIPPLFQVIETEDATVQKFVSKWSKFQELMIVLGASMRELVDRWAEGKGPLASVYTAEEVKQLIRALFQNTDGRAAVLAKIK